MDPLIPLEIIHAVLFLKVHGNSFKAIGDFHGNGVQADAPGLLEVGELGDFHSVQPHLPAQPGRAQRGRLPVVLHETDIVIQGIDAQRLEAVEIHVLNLERGGFDDHLELIVVFGFSP